MSRVLLVLACLGLFCANGFAADNAKKNQGAPKEDFALTGKLSKEDKKVKGKDNVEKVVPAYYVTDDAGTRTALPQIPPAKAGAADAPDPSKFVDKRVTIECSGVKKTKQVKGKDTSTYQITTVKSIKEVAVAAPGGAVSPPPGAEGPPAGQPVTAQK